MKTFRVGKVWKQGDSLAMVVPAIFAEELDIKPGTWLEVRERAGKLIVQKMRGSQ